MSNLPKRWKLLSGCWENTTLIGMGGNVLNDVLSVTDGSLMIHGTRKKIVARHIAPGGGGQGIDEREQVIEP